MTEPEILDLYDLLLEQLRDLYDGERQQLKALPGIGQQATSPELQEMLGLHERETHHQLIRLEEILSEMEEEPTGESCEGIKGLITEARKLINRCKVDEVIDAGIITSIQHINHYEMAGYGTAISYAKALSLHEIAALLLDSLREEKHADIQLSDLAEDHINVDATWTSLVARMKGK